jgi:succinate dehydrogenase cytochrome b556 subunit
MRDDVHGRDGNQEKASKEFGFAHYQATPSGYPVNHSPHQRGRAVSAAAVSAMAVPEQPHVSRNLRQRQGVVAHPLVKIVLLGLIWFYMHHFCAGIRYLLLDLHKGVELEAARLSSKVVFAVSIALTLIIGAKVLW